MGFGYDRELIDWRIEEGCGCKPFIGQKRLRVHGRGKHALTGHEDLCEEVTPALELHAVNHARLVPVEAREALDANLRHHRLRYGLQDGALDGWVVRVDIDRHKAIEAARYAQAEARATAR